MKGGEGSLGRLLGDDDVVDRVNETLSGINKVIDSVDSIYTEMDFLAMVDANKKPQVEFNLDINSSPERYYRFGIVTPKTAIETKNEKTVVVDNSAPVVTETTERESGKYYFNAMIGRRVDNWGFRIGLIESSGGVGVDYNFSSYNTKFHLDFFNYQKDPGLELRMGMDMNLWNVFYGRVFSENIHFNNREFDFGIGVGIRFKDDDLKNLVGFFF